MQKSVEANLLKTLLDWCKQMTLGYQDVNVVNFTTSWRNGLAFCALMHRFNPALIDFASLSKDNLLENNRLAFEAGEQLGVPALLDPEDMIVQAIPDKMIVVTYLSTVYCRLKDRKPTGGPHVVGKNAPRRPSICPTRRASKVVIEKAGVVADVMDICEFCKERVHIIERFWIGPHLYHRNCYVKNSSSLSRMSISGDGALLALSGTMATPGESELRMEAGRRSSKALGEAWRRGTLLPVNEFQSSKPRRGLQFLDEPLKLSYQNPPPVRVDFPDYTKARPKSSDPVKVAPLISQPPVEMKSSDHIKLAPLISQPPVEMKSSDPIKLAPLISQPPVEVKVISKRKPDPAISDGSVQSGDVAAFTRSDSFRRRASRALLDPLRQAAEDRSVSHLPTGYPKQRESAVIQGEQAAKPSTTPYSTHRPPIGLKQIQEPTLPIPQKHIPQQQVVTTVALDSQPLMTNGLKSPDLTKNSSSSLLSTDSLSSKVQEPVLSRQGSGSYSEPKPYSFKLKDDGSAPLETKSRQGSGSSTKKKQPSDKRLAALPSPPTIETKSKEDKVSMATKPLEVTISPAGSQLSLTTSDKSDRSERRKHRHRHRKHRKEAEGEEGKSEDREHRRHRHKHNGGERKHRERQHRSSKDKGNDSTASSVSPSSSVSSGVAVLASSTSPSNNSTSSAHSASQPQQSMPTPPPMPPTAGTRKTRLSASRSRSPSVEPAPDSLSPLEDSGELIDNIGKPSSFALPAPPSASSLSRKASNESFRKVHFNETVRLKHISPRGSEPSSEDDSSDEESSSVIDKSRAVVGIDVGPPSKAIPVEIDSDEENPFQTGARDVDMFGYDSVQPIDGGGDLEELEVMAQRLQSFASQFEIKRSKGILKPSTTPVNLDGSTSVESSFTRFTRHRDSLVPFSMKARKTYQPEYSNAIREEEEKGSVQLSTDVNPFAEEDEPAKGSKSLPSKLNSGINPDEPSKGSKPLPSKLDKDVNPFAEEEEPSKGTKPLPSKLDKDVNPFAEEEEPSKGSEPLPLKLSSDVNPFVEEEEPGKGTKPLPSKLDKDVNPFADMDSKEDVANPFSDGIQNPFEEPSVTTKVNEDNPFANEDENPFGAKDDDDNPFASEIKKDDNPFASEVNKDENPFASEANEDENPFMSDLKDDDNPFASEIHNDENPFAKDDENPFANEEENPFGNEPQTELSKINRFGDENSEPLRTPEENPFAEDYQNDRRKANFSSGVKKVIPRPKRVMSDEETFEPPVDTSKIETPSGVEMKTIRINRNESLEIRRKETTEQLDKARMDEFEVDLRLDSVRQRLAELERQGVQLENRMREDADDMHVMSEFVLLVNERDRLVSEEYQIILMKELKDLEIRQKVAEFQLRELIETQERVPNGARASFNAIRRKFEQELVELIAERNQKTVMLDEAKQIEQTQIKSIDSLLAPPDQTAASGQHNSEPAQGLAQKLMKLVGRA